MAIRERYLISNCFTVQVFVLQQMLHNNDYYFIFLSGFKNDLKLSVSNCVGDTTLRRPAFGYKPGLGLHIRARA